MLKVDLSDSIGVNAKLGEGGMFSILAASFRRKFPSRHCPRKNIGNGDGTAFPLHAVLGVGQRGANEVFGFFRAPAGNILGGKNASDFPETGKATRQRLGRRTERGDTHQSDRSDVVNRFHGLNYCLQLWMQSEISWVGSGDHSELALARNASRSLRKHTNDAENGNMNLGLLREATAREHQSVERHMPLIDPGLTLAVYADVLSCLYTVIAGWDRWSGQHCPADLTVLMEGRQRAGWLEADLRALGVTVPECLPLDIAGLDTERASFLGAMYVVEGSTLGGQYIANALEPRLGLSKEHGTAYFRSYGTDTARRWKEFQAILAQVDDAETDAVIAGAKRMFGMFEQAILPLSIARIN